jgi:hypothetical protein
MDYVYQPEIATMITEWVLYLSPCDGVKELILQDAEAASDDGAKGLANKLETTANSEFAFPSEELLARTSFGFSITNDDAAEEWDNTFLPISQG